MANSRTIIAIDQGTTSSRAILFTEHGDILAQKSAEFPQLFPQDGWVEHNPEDIWATTIDVTKAMLTEAASHNTTPLRDVIPSLPKPCRRLGNKDALV